MLCFFFGKVSVGESWVSCIRSNDANGLARSHQAVILASQADKLSPSSEPLRPDQAMPQVVYILDLLDSFKPSENIIIHCLQGP